MRFFFPLEQTPSSSLNETCYKRIPHRFFEYVNICLHILFRFILCFSVYVNHGEENEEIIQVKVKPDGSTLHLILPFPSILN